jgi:hypothetical protein
MHILIHDSARLCEIQQEFNHHFPNLWIEFFLFAPEETRKFSPEYMVKDTQKAIGDIRHYHLPGHLSINGQQKLSTLEKAFKEYFGLDIRVFIRSTNTWRELKGNGHQTLSELNENWKTVVEAMEDNIFTDFDEYYEQIN